MEDKRILLGVYATRKKDKASYNRDDFEMLYRATQSVVDFLEHHDVRVYPNGNRVYIVNGIEYYNCGEEQ